MDPNNDVVEAQQSTSITAPSIATLERALRWTPQLARFKRNRPQDSRTNTLIPSPEHEGSEIASVEHPADTSSLTPLAFRGATTNDTESSVNPFMSTTEDILRSIKRCGPTPSRFARAFQRRQALKPDTNSVPNISPFPSRSGPLIESVFCQRGKKDTGYNLLPPNENGQAGKVQSVRPIAQNTEVASDSKEKSIQESLCPSEMREERFQPSAELMEIDTSFGTPRRMQGESDSSDEDADNAPSNNRERLDDLELELLDLARRNVDSSVNHAIQIDQSTELRRFDDLDLPDTQRDFDCATQEEALIILKDIGLTKREKAIMGSLEAYSKEIQRAQRLVQASEHVEDADSPVCQPPGKRKRNLRRRLPLGELHLTSQKYSKDEIAGFTKVSKRAKRLPRASGNARRPFGSIDRSQFINLGSYNRSPGGLLSRSTTTSYSDGFIGSEAQPIGISMPMPKPKRVRPSTLVLSTRIGTLTLVENRDKYEDTREPRSVKKPSRKIVKTQPVSPMVKSAERAVPVVRNATPIEIIHQVAEGQVELIETLISEIPPNEVNIETQCGDFGAFPDLSIQNAATDFKTELGLHPRTSSTESGAFRWHDTPREDSYQLSIQDEMKSVFVNRPCDVNEHDDGSAEYDGTELDGDCSDYSFKMSTGEDDEQSDKDTVASHGSCGGSGCEDSEDSEEEEEEEDISDEGVLGEEGMHVAMSSEALVAGKTLAPRSEFVYQPAPLVYSAPQDAHLAQDFDSQEYHPWQSQSPLQSQFIAGQDSANPPSPVQDETDSWRPRRPKLSHLANETEEDIFDSPSIALAQRRKSLTVQMRRRRLMSQSLDIGMERPTTPEIPETQDADLHHGSLAHISQNIHSQLSTAEDPLVDILFSVPSEEALSHFSQLSYRPEESYSCQAFEDSERSIENFKAMRSKSTPVRSQLAHTQTAALFANQRISKAPASQVSKNDHSAEIFPRPLAVSAPMPREENNLGLLTRKVSSSLGTLHGSARKRLKSLPFVPPFKKQ